MAGFAPASRRRGEPQCEFAAGTHRRVCTGLRTSAAPLAPAGISRAPGGVTIVREAVREGSFMGLVLEGHWMARRPKRQTETQTFWLLALFSLTLGRPVY